MGNTCNTCNGKENENEVNTVSANQSQRSLPPNLPLINFIHCSRRCAMEQQGTIMYTTRVRVHFCGASRSPRWSQTQTTIDSKIQWTFQAHNISIGSLAHSRTRCQLQLTIRILVWPHHPTWWKDSSRILFSLQIKTTHISSSTWLAQHWTKI